MAAGILNPPGTEYGPCEEECEHRDCASTRRYAETRCPHCDEPIGYDRRFYNVTPDGEPSWSVLAHAVCEELKVQPPVDGLKELLF